MSTARLLPTSLLVAALLASAAVAFVGTPRKADAAFPGRNGAMVFESYTYDPEFGESSTNIYRVSPDGTGREKITDSGCNAVDPAVSADGQKIAFEQQGCDSWDPDEIWLIDADGSDQVRLVRGEFFEVESRDPAWFPSGDKIVFSGYLDDGDTQGLFTVAFDGSGNATGPPTQMTDERATSPSVSPDGRSVAFRGGDGLYVMRTDAPEGPTNEPVRLVKSKGADHPNWSPDGSEIVYSSNGDIFVMNADGSGKKNLTRTGAAVEREPAFSPNGRRIVFGRFAETFSVNPEIWKMRADASGQKQLTNSATEDSFGSASPDWQPLS